MNTTDRNNTAFAYSVGLLKTKCSSSQRKNIRRSFASAQLTTTRKIFVSEKQILRIVAGLFRTLVVVFVLPNGKQHSRSNLRKGETHED